MASSKLLTTNLRRTSFSLLRPLLLSLSSSSPQSPSPTTATTSFFTTPSRYFSSSPPPDSNFSHNDLSSITESELRSLGFIDSSTVSEVADELLNDSILPINSIVSLITGYHDITGLPWWIVIASSTVAMRITLFPWILLQLHKLQQIDQVFKKLPPPFPPLFSGKSFTKQLNFFWREKRLLGCPSFLWFAAPWIVQIPCFILCMTSVRRMSLDQYLGFDNGGILWFQNLSEVPSGPYGPILPFLIAGLHFCNVQIGFKSSLAAKEEGLLAMLAKCYKMYLELLTLPILFFGFHIPQGSLVYWVSNSSLTLIQQLCLKNPAIRQKLGLHQRPGNDVIAHEKNVQESATSVPDIPKKHEGVSAFDLTPLALVKLAVTFLSAGKNTKALELLRLAVEKDPECYEAWSVMGQFMLKLNNYGLAADYLESAISKIVSLKEPTDEAIDFLILASMNAGVAYYQQGMVARAFLHFERLKDMEVPEEPIAKARYYEGLVVYASFLRKEGRKDEATKYLSIASEYDPQYSVYLKNLENDTDTFVADLASSRRADY